MVQDFFHPQYLFMFFSGVQLQIDSCPRKRENHQTVGTCFKAIAGTFAVSDSGTNLKKGALSKLDDL